ncbi:MAG TPA: hypothetical protein VG819_14875 [Rhizomicrobium sp.]|jgi:hypothetical protein|nr:hypothetical protein [Rhizomicrobium sp.]
MTEDPDDTRVPIAWGDMGALVLAAGASLFALWLIGTMLLGGHPLAALFGPTRHQAAPAPTAEEIRNTPMHLEPGEVRIDIAPAKPKPPKNPPPEP